MAFYQSIDFSKWEILKDLDYPPWNESKLIHVFKRNTTALLVNADGDLFQVEKKSEPELVSSCDGNRKIHREISNSTPAKLNVSNVIERNTTALLVNADGDLFQVEKKSEPELVSSCDGNRKIHREISNSTPAKLNVSNVIALASGLCHAVALDANGEVFSWGSNYFGQLGNNTYTDNFTPTNVDIPEQITQICCGYYCTLALDVNNNVWFCGCLNEVSEKYQHILTPILVISGRLIVDISCGGRHAAMLTAYGILHMWGLNDGSQIGLPHSRVALYPQPITGLPTDIKKVVCGGTSTACLTSDGKVFSWGWLYNNETFIPEEIPLSGKTITICANGENDIFTATLENNEVYFWGDDVSVYEHYPMFSNFKTHWGIFENKKTPPAHLMKDISKSINTNLFSDDDTLSEKIVKLFNTKEYSDLKIQLKNEELYAHKLILALHSKFFADFILNKLEGKKVIDLCDKNTISTRAYIKYLYTSELEDIELANIPELYNLANKDEKKELKAYLLKKWTDKMSEDTIFYLFRSAYMMESQDLAKACKPLLIAYLSKILHTELPNDLTSEGILHSIELALSINNSKEKE